VRPGTRRLETRGIALFEAAKGVVVLLGAFGLLELRHLHLDPAGAVGRAFIRLAGHTDRLDLWLVALAALGYAALRWLEAYGLWGDRRWACWLGALSGGVYVPFELLELWRHPTPLRAAIAAGNLAVVLFLAARLRSAPTPRP
jgi:uncharacterized membrane protein (DUF2068 family)